MAAKILSVVKSQKGKPALTSDEINELLRKLPVRLDRGEIFSAMAGDKSRLLTDEEIRLVRAASEGHEFDDLAWMTLNFVGSSLCARAEEIDAGDINEASAAVTYFAEELRAMHENQITACHTLLMHYERLAASASA